MLDQPDMFGVPRRADHKSILGEEFMLPPFSVLNAREGWWQERKRKWLALGIQSELGRKAVPGEGGATAIYRQGRPAFSYGRAFGQDLMRGEHVVGQRLPPGGGGGGASRGGRLTASSEKFGNVGPTDDTATKQTGTSIFDPVLCEVAYRWFCPPAGRVLDPFAGGSVRGVVASVLGREYDGVDLRPEQVAANRAQGDICAAPPPRWHVGDARNIETVAPGEYDFLFSCPPYANLERYSDNPADLSTLAYPDFVAAYTECIAAACRMLKRDRFACFVVGDVRDDAGMYHGLPEDTAAAFRAAGLAKYNELILVTAVGSLPVRVGKQFRAARKVGKTHQNVLVFVKGDPRAATRALEPML